MTFFDQVGLLIVAMFVVQMLWRTLVHALTPRPAAIKIGDRVKLEPDHIGTVVGVGAADMVTVLFDESPNTFALEPWILTRL